MSEKANLDTGGTLEYSKHKNFTDPMKAKRNIKDYANNHIQNQT